MFQRTLKMLQKKARRTNLLPFEFCFCEPFFSVRFLMAFLIFNILLKQTMYNTVSKWMSKVTDTIREKVLECEILFTL